MSRLTPSWTSSSVTIAADGQPIPVAWRGLGRFAATADDGGLTALCHVGANVLPAGRSCSAFARHALRGRARMIIGEERAVGSLWDAMRRRVPRAREDRPGQPVYVI